MSYFAAPVTYSVPVVPVAAPGPASANIVRIPLPPQPVPTVGGVPAPLLLKDTTPGALDKRTTAFVGSIPEWLDDAWIQRLLELCGPLKAWIRITDASGTATPCGFATFETPLAIHNLLHSLARERASDAASSSAAPSRGVRVRKHALVFKVDVTARLAVTQHMNDALAEEADALAAVRAVTERDRECARGIETFLKESGMWDPSDDAAAVPDADDSMQGVVAGDGGGIAAAADGNNDVDVFLGSIGSSGGHHGGGGKRRGVVEELTEEEEKQRLERREREMHQAYLERVARFERQEATRIRNIEQAEKKAADTQLKRVRDREGMGNLLREWDDDVVAARGEEEFYRDRQRWIHKRNPILRREQETDSRDRFAELEERAKAQAEELEATRQERERAERLQREQEAAAKRAQEELERAERVRREREAEAAERQKEVYHAVAAGHGVVVGRIMTMDERRRAIEELVAALPTGLDEICAWDVKWDFLEGGGEVVHNKIKAFVAKKVVETLGEDNPDITDFVMTSISRRKGAKYILDELAGPLDEDAEVFVKKLWRMVMYESESRARGLA